jgi:ABC-2 type transport system permease protein
MQELATLSPVTYALRGIRDALLDGANMGLLWDSIWPLLIIGAILVPVGLWVFSAGERYAKRTGRLKRSG